MDYISKETARRIIDSGRTKEQMLDMLENTPSVQSTVLEDISEDLEMRLNVYDRSYVDMGYKDGLEYALDLINKHSGKE